MTARLAHDVHGAPGIARGLVWSAWLFAALPAAPLHAAPITASIEGCVTQIPDEGAAWTSTEHFQFVAFWDPIAGCDPTIAHPIVLHEWFENFDGSGGLKVEALLALFPACGRVQFDAHAYLDGPNLILDPLGLVSLVFDTGVHCGVGPPDPPVPTRPPGREDLPEPATIWLIAIGAGVAIQRRYIRRAGRTTGP